MFVSFFSSFKKTKNYEKATLLSFLLVCSISLTAQEFAPIGAEWNFQISYFSSPDLTVNTYRSEKDTVINNKIYRVISRDYLTCNVSYFGDQYIRQSGDSIFWLDHNDNEFLLFDYSANVGDTWVLPLYDIDEFFYTDSIYVLTVDSIYNTNNLAGDSLKTFDVTLAEEGEMETNNIVKARYFEYIGFEIGMFPEHSSGICDANYTNAINCYTDDNVGLLQIRELPLGCDYSDVSDVILDAVMVYPNPFLDEVTINGINFSPGDIKVYNTQGQSIPINVDGHVLRLENMASGMYYVSIRHADGMIVKKILKK